MELVVRKNDLLRELQLFQGIVERKNTIPILANVLMKTMGLSATRGYRKCAKIVGEVMGNFHPHGDASIYDTLVRMPT